MDTVLDRFEGIDYSKNPFGLIDPLHIDFRKVKSMAEEK